MLVLIGSYLLLVFVLPVALSAVVSYRALPVGRDCPHCGSETLRLRDRLLRLASALHRRAALHRRWCVDCGWEGAARIPVKDQRPPLGGIHPRSTRRPRPHPQPQKVARPTQTLDVRSLDVDGTAWRVMLQCWGNTGLFYGRLVFVGPSGRLWLDAVQSFSGTNQREVLGQALSLPEVLLENRLRRLVTDH